jgi:hypothetical protein
MLRRWAVMRRVSRSAISCNRQSAFTCHLRFFKLGSSDRSVLTKFCRAPPALRVLRSSTRKLLHSGKIATPAHARKFHDALPSRREGSAGVEQPDRPIGLLRLWILRGRQLAGVQLRRGRTLASRSPIFRRNLDAFDLAHTGRLASLSRFGNPLMRAEH